MQKLVEEQMALKRIADVAIDIYAITSVLARASRSKSIGLQHCDHEVNKSCYDVVEVVLYLIKVLKLVEFVVYLHH